MLQDCRLIVNINFCIRRHFLDAMQKNIEDVASELDSAKHVATNPDDLQKLGDVIDIYDISVLNNLSISLFRHKYVQVEVDETLAKTVRLGEILPDSDIDGGRRCIELRIARASLRFGQI